MNTPSVPPSIDAQLSEKLLFLPTLPQQITFLQDVNLLHSEGLLHLLDYVAQLVRHDPGQARRLAKLCADVADHQAIVEVMPRAAYIQAQTYALAGEFNQALDLIQKARNGYVALGQELPALRTTAGLMHVLGELGQYVEALEAGQAVLDKIGRSQEPPLIALAALIHQNMGMCYNFIGRYDEALMAYHTAETHYLNQGMAAQAGDISNNRGVLLWEMGRGTEALAALEKALAIRQEAGLAMLQAQSLSNIGSVHLLLGHYTQSLAVFEQARRLFASLDGLVDQHVLLLDTATAYLTLNLFPEAQTAYEEANRLLQTAGVVHHRARALWGLGATLLAQKQLDAAEKVLAESVAILEATSDAPTPLLATILLEQASVQAARHQWETAVTTATRALNLVTDQPWPVPAIYAHLQLADLSRDNLAQAQAHLAAAQQLAAPFNLPHLRYRLQQRLGRLHRLQGRHQEAQVLLEAAIAEVERLRGTLAQETMRTAFLQDKVAVYNELMQLYLSRGDEQGVHHAFLVAEQAKSRTLLDLISGTVETEPSASVDRAEAAQLQKLQADLNAIYNEFLNSSQNGPKVPYGTIHTRATELETAINQLRLRQAATSKPSDLWATPLPLQSIQAQLSDHMILLSYHVMDDEILAFVVGQHSARIVRGFNPTFDVQVLIKRLSSMLDRLRASQVFTKEQIIALELSVRRVLHTLYKALIAPLEIFLAEKAAGAGHPQQLVVVPHGCLHQVPFHALFDGYRYLIDRFEISYAPSATIYSLCQQRPALTLQKALITGVPDTSIPAVTAEIKAVASYLPHADVLVDEQATLVSFRDKAIDCELLHLACHGLFRADNPLFSALKLHDGWLTATDAMQLRLQDALVTLSACESGHNQVAGGDELLGLLRGFLSAGAVTVVVSLWLAQDDTTANLMSHWYERLCRRGMSPAAALRAAQLALKAEYPHPYFWAPFIAVGRR